MKTEYQVAYQLGGRSAAIETLELAVKELVDAYDCAVESGDCQAIRIVAVDYPSDGSDPYGLERELTDNEADVVHSLVGAGL